MFENIFLRNRLLELYHIDYNLVDDIYLCQKCASCLHAVTLDSLRMV